MLLTNYSFSKRHSDTEWKLGRRIRWKWNFKADLTTVSLRLMFMGTKAYLIGPQDPNHRTVKIFVDADGPKTTTVEVR